MKKKKAHNVGSKGGFMYYLICVKMLLAFMLTRVEEVHHSLTLNLLYPCSHLSNKGLGVWSTHHPTKDKSLKVRSTHYSVGEMSGTLA